MSSELDNTGHPAPAAVLTPRPATRRRRGGRSNRSRQRTLRDSVSQPSAEAPVERAWPWRERWTPPVALGAGLVLVTLYALRPISDPDIWWHLKTGEIIVNTGQIPRVDVYSHTAAGKPWVAHEWLSQVIFHLSTRPFGLNGLRALNAAAAIVLLLLLWRRCRQACASPLVAAAVWAACVTLCMPFMTWRPQIFSIPILLLLLPRILFPAQAVYSAKRLMLLVAGFWVWANLHSMAVLGVVLLGVSGVAVWVGQAIRRRHGEGVSDPIARRLPILMGVQLVAAIMAVSLTPGGLNVYWYATVGAWLISHSSLQIVEWLPGVFDWLGLLPRLLRGQVHGLGLHEVGLMIAMGLTAAVLLRAGQAVLRRETRCAPGLALALFGIAAALAARRGAWLLILAALFVACPALGRVGAGRRNGEAITQPHRTAAALLALLVCLTAWVGAARAHSGTLSHPIDAERYPVGLSAFLQDAGLEGDLCHVLGWGGYLIYKLHPNCRIMIHGEVPMYERWAPSVVETYRTLENDEAQRRRMLPGADFDLFLARAAPLSEAGPWLRTHDADALLSGSPETRAGTEADPPTPWIRVFTNREGSVYLNPRTRRGPANLRRCRDLYARHGVALTVETGVDTAEILRTAPRFVRRYRLVPDGYDTDREHAASGAAPPDVQLRVARALLRLDLPADATPFLQAALRRTPNDLDTLVASIDAAHDRSDVARARVLTGQVKRRWPTDRRVRFLDWHMAHRHPADVAQDTLPLERRIDDELQRKYGIGLRAPGRAGTVGAGSGTRWPFGVQPSR